MSDLPLGINIIISQTKGIPCLELRKNINDIEQIKIILSCAFREQPLSILPLFSNKIRSISTLIDKGLTYKDGENYFFNF